MIIEYSCGVFFYLTGVMCKRTSVCRQRDQKAPANQQQNYIVAPLLNAFITCLNSLSNGYDGLSANVFHLSLMFFHWIISRSCQNFYKTELNKEEMYIRYIHKLYDLHLKAQNYTGTLKGIYCLVVQCDWAWVMHYCSFTVCHNQGFKLGFGRES